MKYLLWDFDGTLGYRVGMWSQAVLDVLHMEMPDFACTVDQIRPHLRTGFPWHSHEQVRENPLTPEQWWHTLSPVFEQAYCAIGVETVQARRLSTQVRSAYTDLQFWHVFDDTFLALEQLSGAGWKHTILSNHVPELSSILHYLRLDTLIEQVFNSAETGYEKPHPLAFHSALEKLNDRTMVWMVGDSVHADIAGANAAGIPAILVHSSHEKAQYVAPDLTAVVSLLAQYGEQERIEFF